MIVIRHNKKWFKVGLRDGFRITRTKLELFWIRFYRRIKLFERVNEVTLLLLPAWAIFLIVTWGLGFFIEPKPSLFDLIWEYRTAFFTSFVIVICTNTAIWRNKYQTMMWFRSVYYRQLTELSDEFASYLYSIVTCKEGAYKVFQSKQRFDNFVANLDHYPNDDIEVHSYIKKLKRLLDEIKKDSKYELLYFFDGASCNHIDICVKRLQEFDDKMFLEHLSLLFDMIHNLGYIWRLDIDRRVTIDKILHEKYGYKNYDNLFLYEIYCCDDINSDPFKEKIFIE